MRFTGKKGHTQVLGTENLLKVPGLPYSPSRIGCPSILSTLSIGNPAREAAAMGS